MRYSRTDPPALRESTAHADAPRPRPIWIAAAAARWRESANRVGSSAELAGSGAASSAAQRSSTSSAWRRRGAERRATVADPPREPGGTANPDRHSGRPPAHWPRPTAPAPTARRPRAPPACGHHRFAHIPQHVDPSRVRQRSLGAERRGEVGGDCAPAGVRRIVIGQCACRAQPPRALDRGITQECPQICRQAGANRRSASRIKVSSAGSAVSISSTKTGTCCSSRVRAPAPGAGDALGPSGLALEASRGAAWVQPAPERPHFGEHRGQVGRAGDEQPIVQLRCAEPAIKLKARESQTKRRCAHDHAASGVITRGRVQEARLLCGPVGPPGQESHPEELGPRRQQPAAWGCETPRARPDPTGQRRTPAPRLAPACDSTTAGSSGPGSHA